MRLLFTKRLALLFFFLGCAMPMRTLAQNFRVEGSVTDAATGETLIGVSITLKGTKTGTLSGVDGRYSLPNVPPGAVLVVSYLGYEPLNVPANAGRMDIRLKASNNVLEDVVVIGYGSVKRRDVTTAISSISTKDLDQRPIVSAAQAIQGRAAGVSVIQPNGTPGAEMSIRVRGTTSFNGSNDPLYVVDGVPVDNIRFLSPTDIESMQILKDASSAAIYGSRAANGVILISTKAGKSGEAKIALNAQFTQNKVTNEIDVLNLSQYRQLQNEIGLIALPDGLTDQTDWFDETYKTGQLQNYQVSISDGTEKLKYYLSAGYLDETGVLNTSFFKRYNVRANIDNKVRKWLTIGANVNYADYSNNGVTTGLGANRGGVILSVINTPTYAPVWNPENTNQYYNNFYGASNITSPIENMARSRNNRERENRLIASGNALFTFLPELNFKTSFTLDRRNALNTTFLDPISTTWGRNQYGEASDNRNMNTVLTFDNVLTYNRTFSEHGVEVMAGSSYTDSDYSNSYINGSHFRDDQIQTLNAANRIGWNNTGSGASQWAIMSYFGRVAYNFESKYLLTANIRADGSSRLHPDHRWGYFPSLSAAWRISSEDFMDGAEWLNDLKIRGGWGQTGNQSGLNDYAYLQRYSIGRIEWFKEGQENALPTISKSNIRTKDLTWETTTQSNVGLDFTAFRNRLTVNLDYYYKRTTDMLMSIDLPAGSAAANTMQRNEGVMVNKGFEVLVNSQNVKGPFTWNTDFNISFNKNNLEDLATRKIYSTATTSDVINEAVVRNEPGRPMSGFFGYISDGVDPETGELMYRDLNGDSKISSTDRTYIGDPNPDFIFGLTNSFSYKNLNLSVFLQGSYGNDIFNASRIETEGMYDGKNQSTRVLDRWRVPGQITDVPRAGFELRNSSYFIEDGSYLRVKNVSLSYNVQGQLLKKLKIARLQPYISASNLLTWTNYSGMDPEVNQWGNNGAVQGIDWGTYPQSKSFVFGLNVEF
ncbi:MAG: SusC/RagA family TonB-linked outer membrane protein [Arcticibacter sp.]